MAVSLQKFSYSQSRKLLNLNSWLAVQRYIRKEKTGMKVYCVITETDQGIDLSGVYWNLESAVEHVKRRFYSVFQECVDDGCEMIEGDNFNAPDKYGATIYLEPDDYWIWRVYFGEVRDECLVSGPNEVVPPLEGKRVDEETLMNCLLL